MSTTTASSPTTKRIFNFNAGPAALPLPVLERIRGELLDWRGSGMSVMEMSHRSPEYESINASAEQKLRSLLAIPEDYAVIFVQGGGSLQFSMAPMNLCLPGKPVDVLHTGAWTAKAIFAGAQKNLGPSGVTIIIIHKDLAERAARNLPTLLQYRTHIKDKSLYHTPPTFAVYVVGLVLEWMESLGGLPGIQKRNDAKAKLLYDAIDTSGGFYRCPVENGSRSKMNVVFRVAGGDEAIEKQFAKQAAAAGLAGTPGHRSVGGMRASLYNAVALEAVQALTGFMREFQRTRG